MVFSSKLYTEFASLRKKKIGIELRKTLKFDPTMELEKAEGSCLRVSEWISVFLATVSHLSSLFFK